jgi:hypothetical protein
VIFFIIMLWLTVECADFLSVNTTINKINNTDVCLCSFYYHYMFRSLWIIIRWSYQFNWIIYYSYWKFFGLTHMGPCECARWYML